MLEIPVTQSSADFQFSCGWRMDLGDANNVPLVLSIALVTGVPLLGGLRANPKLPRGELVVIDTTGAGTDPTFDSIGRQHKLLYATKADLAATGGA